MKNKAAGRGWHTRFMLFASVLLLAMCGAWPTGAQAQRRPIATLFVAGPYVTLNGAPAATGMTIYSGDLVVTGPESSAKAILFAGGSVQLDENTDPWFQDFVWQGYKCIVQVILNSGEAAIDGSNACVSHGPNFAYPSSEFVFRVDRGGDTLTVTEGHVMAGGAQWTTVTAGTQASLAGGRVVAQRQVSAEEIRRIIGWRYRYRFTQAAAPPSRPLPTPQPLPMPPSNWVRPPPPPTACPPGWVYNQAGRSCVPGGAGPFPVTCGPGLRYDPRTGRCVRLGAETVPPRPPQGTCGPGLRYDPRTERCVPLSIETVPSRPPQVTCGAGLRYDPRTGRCVRLGAETVPSRPPQVTCGPGLQYDRQKGSCEPIPPR